MSTEQLDILSPPTPPLNWSDVLNGERKKDYFKKVLEFVENERRAGKIIYPKNSDIFNALKYTPFDKVKAVIIGQDPYHGPNQAHGLCFSVQKGVTPPPSLQNIFKELSSDLGINPPEHGSLEKWAHQGVLLLNAVLTVEAGKPQSHAGIGWEIFTDKVIEVLNRNKKGLVFILWGASAQKKCASIDTERHYIIKSPHPSPLSASRGFFGSKPFSRTNKILESQGIAPIDWSL
ncbi:MAG: uracil-DNA glycosylase [Candidatus Dadabacteria bacterium]|nr:MAG: uracil-DNA glycosylase [Candidatus Dadabacteria bacterium]